MRRSERSCDSRSSRYRGFLSRDGVSIRDTLQADSKAISPSLERSDFADAEDGPDGAVVAHV